MLLLFALDKYLHFDLGMGCNIEYSFYVFYELTHLTCDNLLLFLGLVHWDEYLAFFFENRSIKGVTPDDVRNRTPPFMALPKDIKGEYNNYYLSNGEISLLILFL